MSYCYTCNGQCKGDEYHQRLNEEIEQMNEQWATAEVIQ